MERSVNNAFSAERFVTGHEFSPAERGVESDSALVPGGKSDAPIRTSASETPVLALAALHSLGWLYIANLLGIWLAVLLLFPNAGHWLGEWSYGRWTPVHLNFQLYGWMALPLVAWAMRIYRADRGPIATWSRAALVLWSLALIVGAVSWLQGN